MARSAVLYVRSGDLDPEPILEEEQLNRSNDPAWIAGDAVQIQIAIVNLLRNASQVLAETGTASPWIGIGLTKGEGHWILSVADNGPGFPQGLEAMDPLESSRSGGSGLGLFVVRTTMDNHGGQMTIDRSSHGGAQVNLLFPFEDAANATARDLPTSEDPRTGD